MNGSAQEGRVALIAGGSRGLGLEIARHCASHGYEVFLSGVDADEVDAAVAELRAEFPVGTICGLAGDVGDPAFAKRLFDSAIERLGRVDMLVCNAGVDIIKAAVDYSPEEWDLILSVNLKGAFFIAQAAAKHWIGTAQRAASITMTSSIAGSVGIANLAPYAASKGGMNQLVRTLALEWADHGIRVNAVAPGYLKSIMVGTTVHEDPATEARIMKDTPLSRRAELKEVAAAVLFLASPAASYITGTILPVDGGYTAR